MRFEHVMEAGRTRPLLLECEKRVGERRLRARFVTKGLGLPEVHESSLASEWMGARLARACGLAVPVAEAVIVSPAFLGSVATELAAAGVRLHAGLAAGVEFLPGLLPFPVPAVLAETEIAEAAAVYVFDLLTQNPDRTTTSPNCGRAGGRIVPFDFETCFSFRLAIGRGDPWRVAHLPFVRRHLFHDQLRRAAIEWPEVFARFRVLSPALLDDLCSTMPAPWADVGREARMHVLSILDHWTLFENDVLVSLRGAP